METEQAHTQQMDTEHTQCRAELWMREHSPSIHDRQQIILAQLQNLTESGHLDAYSVGTWDKHLGTTTNESPTEIPTRTLGKAREFETWADQTGHSLPGFRRRTQSSLITDTTQEVITPPILCLALYEDETLSEVVPHSGPEGHHTVTERLQSLTPNDES
jgi:hypothetical protein